MQVLEVPSFDDLRSLVRKRLCDRGDLHYETPMLETLIVRRGRCCGVEFVLFGPRNERLSAIWEMDAGRILLYDQNVVRFDECRANGPVVDFDDFRNLAAADVRCAWQGR